MILKSFLLGNLVSLCMKIINSVIVVGLYYGFLTTFSIGPSYLFLIRAQFMEEREEGTEKKVSAITGFITGQLMMFISIYYAPLHLALGRPHTITVLALPYLLFHFFWNNHINQNLLVYGSTTRNSMRNLSIQCIFLNNIIFQFFNHFILPSSMLARLVNIFMFRCNNKMLFVTSSFFGWLIGHILFMKWIVLVLVWIGQNHSIRSNVLIRFYKYIMYKLINFMARIFSILLFITCVYHLGRIPSPILTNKLKKTSETKGIQKESQDVFTEKDPSPFAFSEKRGARDKLNGKEKTKDELHFKATCYKKKTFYETSYLYENKENLKLEKRKNKEDKSVLWFEKPLVTLLFDYKRWNHPLRYIKNDRFENAVINEMSQYFFYTCQSDGKLKISFTYLPSLLTFLEMIQRKISLNESALEILSSNKFKLYNYWIYTNEYKKNKQTNEAINRIEALDKEYPFLDILEKKTRLCNCDKKKEYLPKRYDPFFNGPFRETKTRKKKKRFSPLIINETLWINKIHGILLTNSREFEQKISYPFDKLDKQSLLKKISNLLTFNNLYIEFAKEPTPNLSSKGLIFFTKESTFFNFLFHVVMNNTSNNEILKKKSSGVKGIRKKVSRRSYKLIDELEEQKGRSPLAENRGIRSRKAKRVIIFTVKHTTNTDTYDTYTKQTNDFDQEQAEEAALIRYSQQSDFRRDIIKGSMRTQRRKTGIRELFQTNIHSLLFLERKNNKLYFFYFEIYERIKLVFRNAMKKNAKLKISNYKEEDIKEMEKNKEYKREEEGEWIKIEETWDTILFAQVMRGYMLVTQSVLRKYIILPSLIIAKNISRMLLFQPPEWSEDLNQWNREIHVKCTYNGVQLSETEFPKDWLTDGIQIKIIFPFNLKPWYRAKPRSLHRNPTKIKKEEFCFLTIWGLEAELPFGPPRKKPSFFEPIFKILKKKIIKLKNMFFTYQRFIIISNKRAHFLLKDTIKFITKNELIIKTKNLPKEKFNFKKKVYESSQTKKEKNSMIKNKIIYESSIQKESKKDLPTENKIKNLIDNPNKIMFISTIKKLLNNNKNSHILFGLSYLSQTYIFYKLSKIKIIYLDTLRYVLQYSGKSFFLKNVITKSFITQGICHCDSKLRYKKLWNYEKNKWKNWLKGYYQYDLSPTIWSQLVPQKWRNRVNQHSTIKKKDLNKEYLYEKSPLIHQEKQFEKILVSDQNLNFKKHYIYDLLSYKSINYETKATPSSIYMYVSPLQVKKKSTFLNSNTDKKKSLDMVRNIPINNFFKNSRRYDNIKNMEKGLNIKYFDCKIISLKKKVDIFYNKSFFYLTIYQKKDNEILNESILNMELWFLQKFVLLYKDYKIKPWVIPTKSLFFYFNENVKKNRNINQSKKKQQKNNTKTELDIFLKRHFFFQLRWDNLMKQKMINNIKVYCLLLRLLNPKKIALSSIRREEMSLDIMFIKKKWTFTKAMKRGILILEPIRLSVKKNRKFFIYQIVSISCFFKSKRQTNQRKSIYIDKTKMKKSTAQHQKIDRNTNFDNLFVPETILSPRRCREFRIRICFNLKKYKIFCNNENVKHCGILDENKYFDSQKKNFNLIKIFFWPNFRLEDLTCINRYWFDTNNGIRFSILRTHMYLQLKIR
uniref:hypothetical chloroplast RF1 n=1 Tax=Psittacanthus schiedeanus TaxID=71123 RepID=UPI002A7F95D7|nr:hypothetical chloroplast RF1 [Psittacanthus schiedeanus]WOX61577.1 hypothetical chloroplast RF1 [Psittacanthus schiedeanus]